MCSRIERMPGKFEGESCIAKVAYSWMMDGMSDEHGSTEEGTPDVFHRPFTTLDTEEMCGECERDVLQANSISLYESNDGFITVEID